MMLDNIKNKILENVGIRHKFKYNGSRNQIEEFYGFVNNCYNAIFTIKLDDGSIKSFSYSDVLINCLEIIN